MPTPFTVPASGTIDYQSFRATTNFTEDKWVQAIEIRPGTRRVVHHVLLFASDPGAATHRSPWVIKNPEAPPGLAQRLLEARRAEGRVPQRDAERDRAVLIASTAPGTNAVTFEPGTALLVKAGSVLTFQVHYTAMGEAETDRTSVGLVFARETPRQEIHMGAFTNALFSIPPGENDQRVASAIEFRDDSHIWALFPHTHLRGKDWEYRLVYPDGRSEVVLSVPKYDFNWQTYYEYSKPIAVPKGSRLEAVAHYDNSTRNKSNPNPNIEVFWGDQTWNEMQYSGITYTIDTKTAASDTTQPVAKTLTAVTPSTINGNWTLTLETPRGAMESVLVVKIAGEDVSGTMRDPFGGSDAAIKGTFKGQELLFTTTLNGPQGPIELHMRGTVSGDEVTGSFSVGPISGAFTAKRAS